MLMGIFNKKRIIVSHENVDIKVNESLPKSTSLSCAMSRNGLSSLSCSLTEFSCKKCRSNRSRSAEITCRKVCICSGWKICVIVLHNIKKPYIEQDLWFVDNILFRCGQKKQCWCSIGTWDLRNWVGSDSWKTAEVLCPQGKRHQFQPQP